MDVEISKDWTVDQVLKAHTQLAVVLLHWKTDCVGCRLDRFCTLEDVARNYGFDLEAFLKDLKIAIEGTEV